MAAIFCWYGWRYGGGRMSLAMFRRLLPLLLIAAAAMMVWAFDLHRHLTFATLAEHRQTLLAWVDSHPWLAPLGYIGLYILIVTLSLPGAAVMTVSGGFLFGAIFGSLYAVTGATIGAVLLFLIAKTSLGDYLLEHYIRQRQGSMLQRLQQGFADNALSFMFVLRLIPLFPFFLVNLAPAFLGVPLSIFVVATFFGIMPGGFVYALAGSGLGSIFDQGKQFSLQGLLTPELLAALLGLAVLALLPVAWRHWHGREEVPHV
jgi:uncharacterized membrane protein YdjX (TVP38/TMEM64 family)